MAGQLVPAGHRVTARSAHGPMARSFTQVATVCGLLGHDPLGPRCPAEMAASVPQDPWSPGPRGPRAPPGWRRSSLHILHNRASMHPKSGGAAKPGRRMGGRLSPLPQLPHLASAFGFWWPKPKPSCPARRGRKLVDALVLDGLDELDGLRRRRRQTLNCSLLLSHAFVLHAPGADLSHGRPPEMRIFTQGARRETRGRMHETEGGPLEISKDQGRKNASRSASD